MTHGFPAGWTPVSLVETVGKPRPKSAPSEQPDLPFVGMESIAPGTMSLLSVGRFGDMKSAGGIFKAGDVLYGRMRPYLNKVHRARHSGACSAEFIVIPPGPMIDGDFLAYLLHHRAFVNFASAQSSGDRPRVDFEGISAFQFGLPPKPEQRRIVSRIDELFGEIDQGQRALERAKQLVQSYRQSVLTAAVTGKLTSAWRDRSLQSAESGEKLLEEIAASSSARRSRQVVVRPEDVAKMPGLPVGWTWARAEAVCGFITKGTTPPASAMHSEPTGVPFIKVYNLTLDGSLDFSIDPTFVDESTHVGALSRSRLVPGDVIMNIVGPPLGKVSIVPDTHREWNMNQAVCVFRALDGLERQFLAYYLLSRVAQDWLASKARATVGQVNLTLEICRDLPIPIPPLNEQRQIIQLIATELARLDNLSGSLAVEAARGKGLRESILKAAFCGQLVAQDRADKPAGAQRAHLTATASASATPAKLGRGGRPAATAGS